MGNLSWRACQNRLNLSHILFHVPQFFFEDILVDISKGVCEALYRNYLINIVDLF